MESIGQEILLHQNSFLLLGGTIFCSNIVQIKSLEGVCLKNNNKGFSATTMKMLVEVILLHKR